MSEHPKPTDIRADRLRCRIALSIALDEHVIEALAIAAATLRDGNDPGAGDLDNAIRTHRINILKQRAILGAAGIDV
ncbi:hypothetical protein MMR14E_05210 [Methylobacterium mesophilicum]